MIVKKAGGRIFGADLTSAEKKALDIEILKQLEEYVLKHELEVGSLVLYVLRKEFGWGETRLKRFYESLAPALEDLSKRYEMGDSERAWLCTRMLLEDGIDIQKWHNERTDSK